MDSSENIFVERDRQRAERAARWGLSDLEGFAQGLVELEAEFRIQKEKITDDADKQKVYDDIKRQFLEYMPTKITRLEDGADKETDKEFSRLPTPVRELPALSENIFAKRDRERDQERIQHATCWGLSELDKFGQEQVKWTAERLIRKEGIVDKAAKREVYEIVKAQYLEYSAEREKEENKEWASFLLASDPQQERSAVVQEQQSETLLLKEELRQLREEFRKFDERLKRLEKYTEE